uniref:Dirigent protein n=1 Tax=Triticum urartu TaxID=4572 RepID=A0A8R7R9I2_TRIUA
MQGLAATSKLSLAVVVAVFLLGSSAAAAHGLRRVVSSSSDEPCNEMTLYYHDILYNGVNNTKNATSAAATKPTALSTTHWKNGTYFGTLVVFDGGEGATHGGGGACGARPGLLLLRQAGVLHLVVWLLHRVQLHGTQEHHQPRRRGPHGRQDPGPLRRRRHWRLLHGARHRHAPTRCLRGNRLFPSADGHQALRVLRLT